MLGSSAGAHMVAAMSTRFDKRLYPAVDDADGGHLAVPRSGFVLNPDIRVSSRTPPTFLLQAQDDPVDPVDRGTTRDYPPRARSRRSATAAAASASAAPAFASLASCRARS